MAKPLRQRLGAICGGEGLQVPLGTLTASDVSKAAWVRSPTGSPALQDSGPRSSVSFGQGRNFSGDQPVPGVLRPAFHRTKEDGGLASSSGPVPLESVSQEGPVQDGFRQRHSSGHSTGGLGCKRGSERRVFSRLDPPGQAPIPPVRLARSDVSVPGLAVRPIPSSVHIHQGHNGASGPSQDAWHPLQNVPRRLARTCVRPSRVSIRSSPGVVPDQTTGVQHKPGKVGPYPLPVFSVLGGKVRHPVVSVLPNRAQNCRTDGPHPTLDVATRHFAKAVLESLGVHGIHGGSSSPRSLLQEASATRGEIKVSQPAGSRRSRREWPLAGNGSQTVAGRPLDPLHGTNPSPSAAAVSLYRRVGPRLGRPLPFGRDSWPLGSDPDPVSYQLSGTHGGLAGSQALPGPPGRQLGHGCLGQRDVSGIYPQPGRHKLPDVVDTRGGVIDLVPSQINNADNGIRSRQVERDSRSTEPGQSDPPDGVDHFAPGASPSLASLGETAYRPVCDRVQCETPGLHLSGQRRAGVCSERVLPVMGEHERVCVPAYGAHTQGSGEVQAGSSQFDLDHARLAQASVVLGAPAAITRETQTALPEEGSPSAAQVRNQPPKRGHPCADRMETMRSGLRSQGLRSEVISDVLKSRRPGTDSVYQTRWRAWYDYCRKKHIDVTHPSVSNFASFLFMLHKEKQLSNVTIAGYKSAIVHTISVFRGVKHPSFADSVVITNLLDSFKRQAPARTISFPRWDLFMVLTYLRDKCEPLHGLSIQELTFKTVFLITLALADRVSGIHALSGLPHDIEFDDAGVTLHYVQEFRAKSRPSDKPHAPLRVPRLSNILNSDDEDVFLCPVRSLREYIKRTSGNRRGQRRLFVSVNPRYAADIRKSTISRWLILTVKNAYIDAGKSLPRDPIRAHEIRAISASLALAKGAAAQTILKAASWKNISTFIDFYLRDFCTKRTDHSLGFKSLVLAREALLL